MKFVGIGTPPPLAAACLALALLAAVPARALEERIVLSPGQPALREKIDGSGAPGPSPAFGQWVADGAVLRPGWKGAPEYVLAHDQYRVDRDTDLLLHFDSGPVRDEAGLWSAQAGPMSALDRGRAMLGEGAASFQGPDSALALTPGPKALFARDSRFRDFSIEFWLYPANAESGEVLLMWESVRKSGKDVQSQELSCAIASGRLSWSLVGFFAPPFAGGTAAFPAQTRIELSARSPLLPRTWSHHLLRFDADTGLLEYLVDGIPEAMTHVTSTGREGGTVFTPAIGGQSPLRLAPDFAGLIDEFRIERTFVEEPKLERFGRDPAVVLSPIADLGFTHSRLLSIEAVAKSPGTTGLELAYRVADEAAGWRLDRPAWIPLRPGERLPATALGRYVQVRAELYADGSGAQSPSLSALTLRYEPDPPPPPPAKVVAVAHDGAIELRWSPVPVSDLGGYLVYYGESPGRYFGREAAAGPSPIDAGSSQSLVISGLVNGRIYYFAIASYDAAGLSASGGDPTSRAGEFSAEISARPSRTAP